MANVLQYKIIFLFLMIIQITYYIVYVKSFFLFLFVNLKFLYIYIKF